MFEAANKGTLFIDEIGELPLHLQTKLLRVLEAGSIRRIGGTEYIKVDVRIIAATNREPQEMVRNGKFRQDLCYRVSAFPVTIPSLRERKDDIPVPAEFFLHHIEEGDQQIPLSPDVIVKLLDYDYPGNVRELRNIIERAVILAAGNVVYEKAPRSHHKHTASMAASNASTTRITREQVIDALEKCHGHRTKAAQMLGVSERTIYRHIK